MPSTTFPTNVLGRQVKLSVGVETTIGTPALALTPVQVYPGAAFGMSRALIPDERLGSADGNLRDTHDQRVGLPSGDNSMTVPIDLNQLGLWLSAGFQRDAPTMQSAGHYRHQFNSGALPTAALTMLRDYGAGDYEYDTGLVLSAMKISMAKGDQVARAALTMLPMRTYRAATLPAGMAVGAALPPNDIQDFSWSAVWDGVAVGDLLNIDFSVDFSTQRVQGISGDEWPTRMHFGIMKASGSFKLYGHGAAFRALANSNAAKSLVLNGYNASTGAAYICQFAFFNVRLQVTNRQLESADQLSATFNFECSQVAGNQMLLTALINNTPSY